MQHSKPVIQEELLLLYELSLSIGQSLDPHLISRDFLRSLMSRRNLTAASIWWKAVPSDEIADGAWVLLDAMPLRSANQEWLRHDHPLCRLASQGVAKAFGEKAQEAAAFEVVAHPEDSSWAILPLGNDGMLLMNSASEQLFSTRMLGQLRAVVIKLTLAIQGGLAHEQLLRSQASLRERTDELDSSRRLLQSIIDTTPVRVFWKDRDLRYLGCNPAFAKDSGMARPADLIGKDDFEMGWADQAELYRADDREVIETGIAKIAYEETSTRPTGEVVWLNTSKVPLRDSSGSIIGVLGIYEDVTMRKQTEHNLEEYKLHLEELVGKRTAQLKQAKEAAEAANVAKSAFLTNMSHEIRTPLNAIMGMAHLIRRSGVEPEQLERVSKLENAGAHLLAVVNAILDLSKIEAGRFELTREGLDLERLLESAAEIYRDQLAADDIELVIELSPMPAPLMGDATRLRQAVLNYLSNAVKFTQSGRIVVRCFPEEELAASVRVRFEVEDTGIGIADDQAAKLFDSFIQVDNTNSRRYGGTGLGLAITKRLATLMQGEAGVVSAPGNGSTFWFEVLLDKAGEDSVALEEPEHESASARGERAQPVPSQVLVVEDDPINQEIITALLEDIGMTADVAGDGESALELAGARRYGVILMDIQMPRMDGIQATRKIRALANNADTPIIALTANAFSEDRRRCLEAGMDDFLPKPIDPDLLFLLLRRSLESL